MYKIICTQSDCVYIGSTFNTTRDRFKAHKVGYDRWSQGKHAEVSIYPYFKKFGIDNFRMVLIKEYEVCDRAHLEAYEQLWISKSKCVNRNNPIRIDKLSQKQYREANKEKAKRYQEQYREANKEKAKEYQEQYYEANKKSIKEKAKQYREDNLESRKEYEKQWREANKAKRNAKHDCECGGKYTHTAKSQHLRTKKHQQWQANQ